MAYTKSLWSLRDEVAVQNDIAIATTTTYTAADESAQLALSVDKGDICVRTDIDRTYISLNDTNASMGDWQLLSDAISSVNGYAGVVVLDTDDIAEGGTNQYYTTLRANTDFDTRLATKDTDDLTEGTNLYFTDARADARIAAASINALNDVDTFSNAPISGQGLKWDGTNWVPGDDNDTTYTAGTGLNLSGTVFSLSAPIGGLTDVDTTTTTPTNGQVLKWNGSTWTPQDDTDTDTTYTAGTGLNLSGTTFTLNSGITGLTDVDTFTNSPSSGQTLKWDGSNWVPADDTDTTYTAGTGLDLTGTTFAIDSDIGDLNNVDTTGVSTGDVLKWNGTNWVPDEDDDTVVDFTDNDFTGDGSTTTFTVTNSLFTKAFVYINGVKQRMGSSYSYTISTNANGTDTDITFASAPANSDWIQVTVFA